jgi:hypothetical protein
MIQVFLNLTTTNIWGWVILCYESITYGLYEVKQHSSVFANQMLVTTSSPFVSFKSVKNSVFCYYQVFLLKGLKP